MKVAPRSSRSLLLLVAVAAALVPRPAAAQEASWRGFLEVRPLLYPQATPAGDERAVVEGRARIEAARPLASWLRVEAGLDARLDTLGQVERELRLDWQDRGIERPTLSVRRLSVMATRGGFTLEAGKQFVRWGRADILNPTDRFAPRDFLTLVDDEFLGVLAARATYERGSHTVDAVWSPRFTPSRIPLLDRRWVPRPDTPGPLPLVDQGARIPDRSHYGLRWNLVGSRAEASLSFYDGFNHLPRIEATARAFPPSVALVRTYPRMRMYGGDVAVPTRWFTVKGEGAFYTSGTPGVQEYGIYVVQAERQVGEWFLLAGYAGEIADDADDVLAFSAERGLARAFLARASLTIDANRSLAFETAVRQNGDGSWLRAEYSHATGQHLRTTAEVNWIRGKRDDFLGQYRRNSNLNLSIRYSF